MIATFRIQKLSCVLQVNFFLLIHHKNLVTWLVIGSSLAVFSSLCPESQACLCPWRLESMFGIFAAKLPSTWEGVRVQVLSVPLQQKQTCSNRPMFDALQQVLELHHLYVQENPMQMEPFCISRSLILASSFCAMDAHLPLCCIMLVCLELKYAIITCATSKCNKFVFPFFEVFLLLKIVYKRTSNSLENV